MTLDLMNFVTLSKKITKKYIKPLFIPVLFKNTPRKMQVLSVRQCEWVVLPDLFCPNLKEES